MDAKLTLSDRLILLDILPQTGTYITMKILREFKEQLSFSEEELKNYEIKLEEDGKVSWNPIHMTETKDFSIGDTMHSIIKTAFKKLDDEEKLRAEHLELYEMFTH